MGANLGRVTDPRASSTRPRRWWVAALLNLLLFPAGYAYLGAWRAVLASFVVLPLAVIAVIEATVLAPPGVYAFGTAGLWICAAILPLAFSAHAGFLARRSEPKSGSQALHGLLYVGICLALTMIGICLRAVWPHPTYEIPSVSMSPTLARGDLISVRGARATCGRGDDPSIGQIVIYRPGGAPVSYIARIVARPGQTVALRQGLLVIDGKAALQRSIKAESDSALGSGQVLEEKLPETASHQILSLLPNGELDKFGPYTVPANTWFVLGDNRDNSIDSRIRGAIPREHICGVAIRVLQSKDKRRVGQPL